jgi:hypothetical protein
MIHRANLLALSALFVASTALAEFVEGTITAIDPQGQKMTVASPSGKSTEFKVNDARALNIVKVGSPVRVQANKELLGWNATSIQVPKDQLNIPDRRLLESDKTQYYALTEETKDEHLGMSANESLFSGRSQRPAGGSDVSVRTTRY